MELGIGMLRCKFGLQSCFVIISKFKYCYRVQNLD